VWLSTPPAQPRVEFGRSVVAPEPFRRAGSGRSAAGPDSVVGADGAVEAGMSQPHDRRGDSVTPTCATPLRWTGCLEAFPIGRIADAC
jgi:hypothetical protein